MSDCIEIRGLLVTARVGVPDTERSIPQALEIDVSLSGDFRQLGDDLSRTTDYAAVSEWVRRECAEQEFHLIESLADHLAKGILARFPATTAAGVEIKKFIVPGTRNVAVRVKRTHPS
jgi:dihydroneopterin aldolase